jgi:hypothetical protein
MVRRWTKALVTLVGLSFMLPLGCGGEGVEDLADCSSLFDPIEPQKVVEHSPVCRCLDKDRSQRNETF